MYRSLCKYILLYFFLTPCLTAQVYIDSAQVDLPIVEIKISGNHVTRPEMILRELKQQIGDSLRIDRTLEDWKRIQNLDLFSRVMIYAEQKEQGLVLSIKVVEQLYWLPFPILYLNDRDWSKLSYGAGLIHTNFRGRKESLLFEAVFGYNPVFNCQYTNPWIFGKHQFYWGLQLFHKNIRNKLYSDDNLDEKYSGAVVSLGKRFGYHAVGQIGFGYEEIRFSPNLPGYTLSGKPQDRIPIGSLVFVWDYRDLKEYPHKGWYFKSFISKMGIPDHTVDYTFYSMEVRKYFPVWNSTLAFLTQWTISDGEIPIYDQLYFGYSTRIRGHFPEILSGENRGLARAAFHIPIVPIRYLGVSDNPYMKDLKFGVSVGLFADTGLIWNQGETPDPSLLISGYGAGLHLHLPYIHLLRLEAALDEKGQIEFIADIGVDI